jgi:hypothetical protein
MISMIRTGSVALAVLFASSPCLAQTDVESIRTRVKDGQKVSVTDDGGQVFNGRISAITADGLSMQVGGKSADVRFDRIVRIDRPNDGLANGALIGLGVGAALGLATIAAEDHRDCEPLAMFDCSNPTAGGYAAVTLLGAGLGTAIGVGVDALIHHKREIYSRVGGAHAVIAPAIGRGVRGAAVTLTW